MPLAQIPIQRLEGDQRIENVDQPVEDALGPAAILVVENFGERGEC
jgi:hypothetical protein